MAEKKDFMSELAHEIEEKKTGKKERIDNVDDFQPKARPKPVEEVFAMPEVKEEVVQPTQSIPEVEEPVLEEEPVEERTGILPDSFGQESFQRIDKPKRTISKTAIALGAVGLLLLLGLLWWFFMAPKITMPDFVGKNLSEVSNWAKQNKIESTSIATKEEYNLDYADRIVIAQDVAPGKKVKPSTPITITVSKGPDPEEEIIFPADLKSMTQDEINDWISENKLLKTKVTTQFSTSVESGHVISYELRNADESDFKRGSTLNVVVSKGEAPVGQVTVENFEGKTFQELQTWANNKKVKLDKQEAFSDTVENNHIISQSTRGGEAIKEGDTLTVVVSKGKGVRIPNLVGYTKEQMDAWQANKNNNVVVIPSSRYNTAPEGSIIAQSIPPGTIVEGGSVLEVGVSLYLPILETHSREWLGKDYLELKAKIDEFNSKGANIQAGEYGALAQRKCSDEFPVEGMIINYVCEGGTVDSNGSTHYSAGCERPLNLYSKVGYQVSTGPCTVATPTPTPAPGMVVLQPENLTDLQTLIGFCDAHGIKYGTPTGVSSSGSKKYGDDQDWEVDHTNSKVKVEIGETSYFDDTSFTLVLKEGDTISVYYLTDK